MFAIEIYLHDEKYTISVACVYCSVNTDLSLQIQSSDL